MWAVALDGKDDAARLRRLGLERRSFNVWNFGTFNRGDAAPRPMNERDRRAIVAAAREGIAKLEKARSTPVVGWFVPTFEELVSRIPREAHGYTVREVVEELVRARRAGEL